MEGETITASMTNATSGEVVDPIKAITARTSILNRAWVINLDWLSWENRSWKLETMDFPIEKGVPGNCPSNKSIES